MANNSFYVTEWVGNFSNVGQFAAGSQLTGGDAENIQLLVAAKRLFADISVDEFTTEAMSKVPKGSLIDFVKGYTDRMELAVGREMTRTFHGDGNASVARANGSGSSSTSLTVQALDADSSDIDSVQYLEEGDYIKVGSSAAVLISSVSGSVLTLASAIDWSDEDSVIKASADGGSVTEMQGLKGLIVSTGTVQNVNVANYKNMQAYIDSSSHSIASTKEQYMNRAYLKTVSHRASNKLVGFTNLTVFEAWSKILTALKQTASTDENILGGINLQGDIKDMPYLKFMNGKTYMDIDCWTNHWYNIDPDSLTIGDMGGGVKFSTGPDGKNVWTRKSGYVPEYEATLRFYGNLIMKNPRANSLCNALIA